MKIGVTIFSLLFVIIAALFLWHKAEKEEYAKDIIKCRDKKEDLQSMIKQHSLKELKILLSICKEASGDSFIS